MKRFQNHMISVRQLLVKMRTHSVISVISAAGLATVLIGLVISEAVGNIDSVKYETNIDTGNKIFTVNADKLSQKSVEIKEQISAIKEYLSTLESYVDDGTSAVEDIERELSTMFDYENSDTSLQLTGIGADLHVLKKQINDADSQIKNFESKLVSTVDKESELIKNSDKFIQEMDGKLKNISSRYSILNSEISELTKSVKEADIESINKIRSSLETLEQLSKSESSDILNISSQLSKSSEQLQSLSSQTLAQTTAVDNLSENTQLLTGEINNTRAEVDNIRSMVMQLREEQQRISNMLTETNRLLEQTGMLIQSGTDSFNELKQSVDQQGEIISEQSGNISRIESRIPFSLGVDVEGDYGYIKAGADTVTPFRHAGLPGGSPVEVAHTHAGSIEQGGSCYGNPETSTRTVNCPTSVSNGGYTTFMLNKCTSCGKWEFNAEAVCSSTGGAHNYIKSELYECNIHHLTFGPGGSCGYSNTETHTSYQLICSCMQSGSVYIENSNPKPGRETCVLYISCSDLEAGLDLMAFSWNTSEGGIISGENNTQQITACHRGIYNCDVTVRDRTSGVESVHTVSYEVVNLAH